jgi:YihY family inner membrane protein
MPLDIWNQLVPVNFAVLRRDQAARVRLQNFLASSVRYLFETEVHAYAFSIAANALLSFFPFNMILLSICHRWLHWESAYRTILQVLRVNLPYGAEFVIRNLQAVVQGRPRLQLVSIFMLFFTSSGVFLPLEIALNKVWGIQRNRSFLSNQAVSLALAICAGILALTFIFAVTPIEQVITFLIGWIPSKSLLAFVSRSILEIASVPLAAAVFCMIYYVLPNGKVPMAQVLPAAIAAGILTEVGRGLYTLTLPLFRFRDVYGPFELSVTLLFWAYLGSLLLLFGAYVSAHISLLKAAPAPAPTPVGTPATEEPETFPRAS